MKPRYLWLFLILSCSKEGDLGVNTGFYGDQSGTDIVAIQSENGRKLWLLRADSMFQAGDTIRLKKVELEFFNKYGKSQSVLHADSGVYFQESGNMVGMGHVEVLGNDGSFMRTKTLTYSKTDSLIYTEDSVYIKSKDQEVWGIGLRSDPGLRRIEVVKQVRGHGSDQRWEK